jgi:Asp-tRNA(Asn)/Glu-tRNA(Gln) amidotransferase A subunit family amidase
VHVPAIAIPAGESGGIPIGCQIVGGMASEPMLLDLAQEYESRYLATPNWPAFATSRAQEDSRS